MQAKLKQIRPRPGQEPTRSDIELLRAMQLANCRTRGETDRVGRPGSMMKFPSVSSIQQYTSLPALPRNKIKTNREKGEAEHEETELDRRLQIKIKENAKSVLFANILKEESRAFIRSLAPEMEQKNDDK